jgi:hypothetical protein
METANTTELARLTGFNRSTVRDLIVRHGVSPIVSDTKTGAKEYALRDVLAAVCADRRERATPNAGKARKEAADAEKAEIIVAKLRGELVPIDEMRSSAAELIKTLFQRCVNIAPRVLADKLDGRTDQKEIELILRAFYAGIFNDLRSNPLNFLPSLQRELEQAETKNGDDRNEPTRAN